MNAYNENTKTPNFEQERARREEEIEDLSQWKYVPRADEEFNGHFRTVLDVIREVQEILDDKFEPHSGTPNDNTINQVGRQTKYQNVTFSDQHEPYMYAVDSEMDPTRSLQDTSDASLENFFKRPIKIFEQEWGTGTDVSFDFDPWSLYWENPRVVNRISNYNLLRCKLHLKILINGNGFQYGRAIAAYLPKENEDFLSSNAAGVQADLVGTSQLPHVFLDPCTSNGGELLLPFFHDLNNILIPISGWNDMGRMFVRTLNTLKHANGATDNATISIFAWAEDVSINVLTSVEPSTLSPQSGDEFEIQMGDEVEEANMTGMISKPATTISRWASYLTKVPTIGPFAMATQIGASAVARVAQIFGYCRPAITKAPDPYKPVIVSSLALTNVPDNAQKLTVDDKQELTIDPRVSGLSGVDPLNVREIAKRESFLTKFTWTIGTAPETLLWNARVDPVTWAETASSPPSFHFPACAFAALPFEYWTGSMKFRFQIVASSFHKGRIKVVYDPRFLANNEYNTNYLRIVDISEEQDFTVEIGNGQATTLLAHHYPGEDVVTQMYSTTPYAAFEQGNGVVGVYVVNELTTPNSTVNNDIEVNVFVSMGDDFEVFVPEDYYQNFVFKPQCGEEIDGFEPQSGKEVVPEGQNTEEPSAPLQKDTQTIGLDEISHPQTNAVFAGEAVQSFRTLLKRYYLWNLIGSLDNVDTVITGRFANFPYLRGAVTGAVDTAAGPIPYNYCNTVLLHWVRNAFSGWRGSIRYKMVPRGQNNRSDSIQVQRAPSDKAAAHYRFNSNGSQVYSDLSTARKNIVAEAKGNGLPKLDAPLSGSNGSALTLSHVNGILEFEVPFQSAFRFEPGKPVDYTGINVESGAWDYRAQYYGNSSSVTDIWVSTGEDFQVYFFTGLPRMYYEPSSPPL